MMLMMVVIRCHTDDWHKNRWGIPEVPDSNIKNHIPSPNQEISICLWFPVLYSIDLDRVWAREKDSMIDLFLI